MSSKIEWPVTIGSEWASKSIPGSIWEITMADSETSTVRLNCGHFSWEGTTLLAESEFEAI